MINQTFLHFKGLVIGLVVLPMSSTNFAEQGATGGETYVENG